MQRVFVKEVVPGALDDRFSKNSAGASTREYNSGGARASSRSISQIQQLSVHINNRKKRKSMDGSHAGHFQT